MMFSCLHTGQAYVRFEADEPDESAFLQPFFIPCWKSAAVLESWTTFGMVTPL